MFLLARSRAAVLRGGARMRCRVSEGDAGGVGVRDGDDVSLHCFARGEGLVGIEALFSFSLVL